MNCYDIEDKIRACKTSKELYSELEAIKNSLSKDSSSFDSRMLAKIRSVFYGNASLICEIENINVESEFQDFIHFINTKINELEAMEKEKERIKNSVSNKYGI